MLGDHRVRDVALVLVDLAYVPRPADIADRIDLGAADSAGCRLIGDGHLAEARTDRVGRCVDLRRSFAEVHTRDLRRRLQPWRRILPSTTQA